ncbi:MAG TPA: tRNA-dependent cyclodipeptide synthase [Candidatus Paceibacterota bacterium]|nr:tRNA-dependent cyclodipeptide synthase [Candidatus Paceibacterota bacterium]
MRITRYLNTTQAELQAKKFNILIGISLGNKYFTDSHIKDYVLWAIENTKEKTAVLIPDKIHAINYEAKSQYKPERALALATRKGKEIEEIILGIKKEFKIPNDKLQILHWEEIENETYNHMLHIFSDAFKNNTSFRDAVFNIVKDTPHFKELNLNDSQYEKLCNYVIDELPMLISGVEKNGIAYDLLPYPGFANIDYLAIDLQEGKNFPKITEQLHIKNKLRLIEAYAD